MRALLGSVIIFLYIEDNIEDLMKVFDPKKGLFIMRHCRRFIKMPEIRITLWVALCFGLTSAAYLFWIGRMVLITGAAATDWLSLVAGYLCQAAGLGFVSRRLYKDRGAGCRSVFNYSLLLFGAFLVPALLGTDPVVSAAFGLLMNVTCGVISGVYLYVIDGISRDANGESANKSHKSLVFGGGYALATVMVGILALPGINRLTSGSLAVLFCLVFGLALFFITRRLDLIRPTAGVDALQMQEQASQMQEEMTQLQEETPQLQEQTSQLQEQTPQLQEEMPLKNVMQLSGRTLALACGAVVLASLVKNLGYGFPSSDIAAGLNPLLSRIPYALGLAAAGLINDRDRKSGLICTIAALSTPFIMLSMVSEPIPGMILWGLNYVLFSFFTVFRVMLFLDIAEKTHRPELAPLGLLMGRIGDAAGSLLFLTLSGRHILLVAVTVLLFIPAILLLFRLYHQLYEPEAEQRKSEEEIFETFCLHHDLSARERDLLRLIIEDHTNGEIAARLYISENTVKYHVRNVLQKTGCRNRVELQRKYKLALYPQLEESRELKLLS